MYLNDDRLHLENHRSGNNTRLSGSGTSNHLIIWGLQIPRHGSMLGWSRDVSWCSV